jgi:hypothetical protein
MLWWFVHKEGSHWPYWLHTHLSVLAFKWCCRIIIIHKEKSNKMQQCIKILLFHIYVRLDIFRATHRPSSGQCPPTTCPTTFHVWKTRGCQCSFGLLMMGGVPPETCWASYKCGIIKFWYMLHLVGFFSMNYTVMHGSMNIKFINAKHMLQVYGLMCVCAVCFIISHVISTWVFLL